MGRNAYIKLVPASNKEAITIQEVQELLTYYKEITKKTGEQVSWEYNDAALPYEITQKQLDNRSILHLSSSVSRFKTILIGVGNEQVEDENGETREQYYVQISLTGASTHGDKGKANELCKFLAKKLEGELHLFNGRVMYYYKRK